VGSVTKVDDSKSLQPWKKNLSKKSVKGSPGQVLRRGKDRAFEPKGDARFYDKNGRKEFT